MTIDQGVVDSVKAAMEANLTKEEFKVIIRTGMRENASNRYKRSYIETEKEAMDVINEVWKSLIN